MTTKVNDNWERLVRATLEREQQQQLIRNHDTGTGTADHETTTPESLTVPTNFDMTLQAAHEIWLDDDDPTVARILCEQAYSMVQNLDPSTEGRGVLQFKTGLMSVFTQKLAKKDGARIDHARDVEHLWEFHQRYKRQHGIDELEREEQRLRESGTLSTNIAEALIEVMVALTQKADPDGVGTLIQEELRRIKKYNVAGELTPHKNVPLEVPSVTDAIGLFPEVREALSAISYAEHFPRLPAGFKISGQQNADMFDLLEFVFGFQKDNVRNQRQNVVLALANAQTRLGIPVGNDPKLDEKAINEVLLKALNNYIKWCRYLRIQLAWISLEAINSGHKLFFISLYFLIWGEAANVQFIPGYICYIFHHMAKELDAILDHNEAYIAASCKKDDGSVSFLDQIMCPIYETMATEAARNLNRRAAHYKWPNYDDFNEYFWSPACFELSWPLRKEFPFFLKPKIQKRVCFCLILNK